MDLLASPEPQIQVLQPEETEKELDETLPDMDLDFPTDFLNAQTRSFRHERLSPGDRRAMDWDSYVVESAADCELLLGPSSTSGSRIDNQVSNICTFLISIFSDFTKYTNFLSYRGDAAQNILDLLQKLLDDASLEPRFRAILYVALVRLCRKSELYPRCISLDDLEVNIHDQYPQSSGGFGDVYKTPYQGRLVCVKVLKLYQNSDQSLLHKSFSREAVVWGQLSHSNILPFIGIHRLNDPHRRLCLVSPWMLNGNIHEFLKTRPQLDRTSLICDIASGMEYLHNNGVVHGDLKGLNILVTDSERACLADFGLSYVSDASGLRGHALSSKHAEGGTRGFEAPELVDPDNELSRRTEASDVYAFGMMLSGDRPFGKVKPLAVITKIMKGYHPQRPQGRLFLERGLTDAMWGLMTKCWSRHPEGRPTTAAIVQSLPHTAPSLQNEAWARTRRPGFDTQPDVTITNALSHLQSLNV
ncbi:hypothetical protein C0991_000494 [Blastosporella zonata]|nr:hypothetical protein C0991_000494 [Blastosporella zonata]